MGGGNILSLENPNLAEFAISKAMTSPLIAFKARNVSIYQDEREVLHNPPMNSAYFKWAIIEVGGYQEEYGYGGEDLELDAKLIKSGYKLRYLTNVNVQHMHYSDFKKFTKQMYRHGAARVRVGKKYKKYFQIHHYGPIFLCLMTFSPLFFIPLITGLANGLCMCFKERNFKLFFPLTFLTISFYVCYGFGEIAQLVKVKG